MAAERAGLSQVMFPLRRLPVPFLAEKTDFAPNCFVGWHTTRYAD